VSRHHEAFEAGAKRGPAQVQDDGERFVRGGEIVGIAVCLREHARLVREPPSRVEIAPFPLSSDARQAASAPMRAGTCSA
jgi:hypothetical protein